MAVTRNRDRKSARQLLIRKANRPNPPASRFDPATGSPVPVKARRMGRERNLTHDIENFVTEKREKKQTDRGEYRAEDFTAIELRSAKRAKEAKNQQCSANPKEQKIRPWKIAREWITNEKPVGK